jgi:uncharacterized cupin superfamily protein
LYIGARKLGYRATRIEPGKAFCPLHSHTVEEEMCIVLEGEPTVRSLRGSVRLRRGDIVAFPTGDRSAHQFINESETPCTIFILGMSSTDDVCFYPDSNKILIDSRDVILRAEPPLAYYDGEVP